MRLRLRVHADDDDERDEAVMRERLCLLEEPCGPFLKALLHTDCLQLRHAGSSLPSTSDRPPPPPLPLFPSPDPLSSMRPLNSRTNEALKKQILEINQISSKSVVHFRVNLLKARSDEALCVRRVPKPRKAP